MPGLKGMGSRFSNVGKVACSSMRHLFSFGWCREKKAERNETEGSLGKGQGHMAFSSAEKSSFLASQLLIN